MREQRTREGRRRKNWRENRELEKGGGRADERTENQRRK